MTTPDLDTDHDDGDLAKIHLSLVREDGVEVETAQLVPETPEAIATAAVECLRGLAAMCDPDTALALTRRITGGQR